MLDDRDVDIIFFIYLKVVLALVITSDGVWWAEDGPLEIGGGCVPTHSHHSKRECFRHLTQTSYQARRARHMTL